MSEANSLLVFFYYVDSIKFYDKKYLILASLIKILLSLRQNNEESSKHIMYYVAVRLFGMDRNRCCACTLRAHRAAICTKAN